MNEFEFPHARNTDVDTSHAAVPRKLAAQAVEVLRAYATGMALTDEAAYERRGLTGHQRCSDLRRERLIQRVPAKGLTKAGKQAYRCVITERGLAFLAKRGQDELDKPF